MKFKVRKKLNVITVYVMCFCILHTCVELDMYVCSRSVGQSFCGARGRRVGGKRSVVNEIRHRFLSVRRIFLKNNKKKKEVEVWKTTQ